MRSTRKRACFLREQSLSRNCSSLLHPQKIRTVRGQSLRGGVFSPGAFNGADVTVKDTKRFAESGGWGYFNFNHHEPKGSNRKGEGEIGMCILSYRQRQA